MKISVSWKSILYNSVEECQLISDQESVNIHSLAEGSFEDKIYRCHYHIITDLRWRIQSFEIESVVNGITRNIAGIRAPNNSWTLNGIFVETFNGCADIDISLTPFTNSLPINRLQLPVGAAKEIPVVYIDVLLQQEQKRLQKYTRLPAERYRFENIPNDFEAVIYVDEYGLVTDYPGLFERIDMIALKKRIYLK